MAQRLNDYNDDVEASPRYDGDDFSAVEMSSHDRSGGAQPTGALGTLAAAAKRAQELSVMPDKPIPEADTVGGMPVFRGFRFFRKYGTGVYKGVRVQTLVSEFVGTFCFLFIGILSVIITGGKIESLPYINSLIAAFAHGFALSCSIYMTANISGGHLNPAVSLAGIISHKMDLKHGLLYMCVQFGASVCASLAAELLVPGADDYAFSVPPDQQEWRAFIAEILFTFFFVMVILSTAMDPSSPGGERGEAKFDIFISIAPLVIGFTLTSCIVVGAHLSGACLNPAHAFGPALVLKQWKHFHVYLFGPMLGATGATFLYETLFSPKPFSRR